MVENGEDAYPLNNLSLFPIEFDHQRGKKKKQKLWGKLAFMVYPYVKEVL